MSHKGIFEDSDDSENESGEDFSASEDDWEPGKDDKASDDDDDIFTDDGGDDSDDNNRRKNQNPKLKGAKKMIKSTSTGRSTSSSSSLRSKLFRKYNPTLKTGPKSSIPTKVVDILSKSQFVQRIKMEKTSAASSDSDSSDDIGLMNPNEIDFNSEFFDIEKTKNNQAKEQQNKEPVFDCNAGMNLSDSSDNDGEFDKVEASNNTESGKKPSIVDKINKKSSSEMHDFSSLQDFAKNLESAKAQLEKLKNQELNASKSNTDESDVTKLLSLGEGQPSSNRKRKHKDGQHSDESDWEQVSDDDGHANEIKDIQITVKEGTVKMSRDQKKAIDLEACLKRRLNRDIKEKQVYLHKSSVLCWIAHGNYVNRVINNMKLMELCLKRLPSKNAYPKGDTDIAYFKMLTDWFHSAFELKSNKMFCDLKKLPPKAFSLALQIQTKKIISKCDFVLIFVTMLRTLGLQCRLVINFAVPPIRPPQKDLFVVSTKSKTTAETDSNKPAKEESTSLAKKIKASTEKMKAYSTEKPTKNSSNKDPSKNSEPKPSTSSRKRNQPVNKEADHSYAEKEIPPVKKVKVNVTRMSRSFIEKNTTESMANRTAENASSPHKRSPQSKSIKSKEIGVHSQSNKSNVSKHITHESPKNTSTTNSKKVSKINGNAASDESPKKKSSNPSNKSNEVLLGTPIKMKIIERKNSVNLPSQLRRLKNNEILKENALTSSTTFSPRKTRSKSTNKIAESTTTISSKAKIKLKVPQLDGAHDKVTQKDKKNVKMKSKLKQSNDASSDSDFEPSPPKRIRPPTKPVNKVLSKAKKIDSRVFSTDDDGEPEINTNHMNFWIEAYAEKEKKWIVIDPIKKKVDCIDHVRKNASKPIIYAFAWNNDNTIRDVTPRYCSQFHTSTRKLRAEQLWIDDALQSMLEQRNPRTIIEDVEFSKLQMDTPMPTSISEFKNHPMYALERHLLKFEAIYPRNALTLGYIRNEPIYARECVHTLHSREIWVKQARTVKIGEKPYKIVKARPKWNRVLNQMEEAKPLEIFGFWQTEQYKPPVAENGIVPRNPYGNVELFKPEMLPIGTRHLQLPNLNRVCKKMGVDCAQAVIGFDFHGGSSHPTFDGFVVCEEFADDVIKQWEIEQEEQIRKETEKREARVYGNWKKLIKGLLIRERLKRKFNFGADEKADKSPGKKGKMK